MPNYDLSVVQSGDGLRLSARVWQPVGQYRGDWFWVHGVAEHGGRYQHIAQRLCEMGWRVIISDLRGHGLSAGVRTHVSSIQSYVDDLSQVWKACEVDPRKTVLFGHSMGGLVAIRALQTKAIEAQGLVLSSPLLRIKLALEWYKRLLGPVIRRLAPQLRFPTGISANNLTLNTLSRQRRQGDPLMQRTVTVSWYYAVQRALAEAWSEGGMLACPVVVVQGDNDGVVDTSATALWLRDHAALAEIITVTGGRHEVFNDEQWADVLGRVEAALRSLLEKTVSTPVD